MKTSRTKKQSNKPRHNFYREATQNWNCIQKQPQNNVKIAKQGVSVIILGFNPVPGILNEIPVLLRI